MMPDQPHEPGPRPPDVTVFPRVSGPRGWTKAQHDIIFIHGRFLSSEAKILYIFLSGFAMGTGTCRPGMRTIEQGLGWGRNRVRRYLIELADFGLISYEQGQRHRTTYFIHDACKGSEQTETVRTGGSIWTPEGVKTNPKEDEEDNQSVRPKGLTPSTAVDEALEDRAERKVKPWYQEEEAAIWIDRSYLEGFYPNYARHTHRAEGLIAWQKLMRKQPDLATAVSLAQEIVEVAHEQGRHWTDLRVTPHPATYINGRRWEDGVIIPTSSRPGRR